MSANQIKSRMVKWTEPAELGYYIFFARDTICHLCLRST
jgi:hypothetical protein